MFSQLRESTESEIRTNLSYLAADRLKGRAAGTKEDKIAARYIASRLSEYGYIPFFGKKALVPFEFTLFRESKKGSNLIVNDIRLKENLDFSVPPVSVAGKVTGKLAFVGENEISEIDLAGKIAVIKSSVDSISFKITALTDKGVVGTLFYSDDSLSLEKRSQSTGTSIPVAQISTRTAQRLFELQGKDVVLKTVVSVIKGRSYNVVMKLGQNNAKRAIMLGAHYDHIGMGGAGSGSMNPKINEIHNGADDNASGVASIMESGRVLAQIGKELNCEVVIAAFGGEERGLIGSKAISDTLKKINKSPSLMINLDMVGRMEEKRLQIGGSGTFAQADSILKEINKDFNFTIAFTKDGFGPSDHSSFYSNEVPVLYFSTGVEKQYHTPADDVDLINFPGMVALTDYITSLVYTIAKSNMVPDYRKINTPVSKARGSFKVTLGLIPDFTYDVGDGFKVGPVTDGKPAQRGGMVTGDIITAINSKKVSNIYDYMARLGELKKGDTIEVNVRRDGQEIKLTIQL